MKIVVESEGLSRYYGKFLAINNISFKIYEKECFGILGNNGAGKSTLMRMIYCLSEKSAGKLKVFNLDVNKEFEFIKYNVGIVSQENSLDNDLSVRDNLFIYSKFFGIPKDIALERINKLLSFVGLENKSSERINNLSGGMQRLLMIIRALINLPKLLILDEPTIALDPHVRHFIWYKINKLKEQGITIILATHYMDEAFYLCDRVMILHCGQIALTGITRDLVREYLREYVFELAYDVYYEKIKPLIDKKNFIAQKISFTFYKYIVYCFADDRVLLESIIMQAGLDAIIVRASNLEDLFLKVTGSSLV